MATIYKQTGSDCYYMRFMHKGKLYRESTGKATEKGANKALAKRLKEVKGSGSYNDLFDRLKVEIGKLPENERDKIRQRFAAELLAGTDAKVTIEDAWEKWKDSPKKRNPAATTVRDYKQIWDGFTTWIKEHHARTEYVHEITPAIAESYAGHLWKKGISARTYNKHLKFLRSAFKALKVQAGLAQNVWQDIPTRGKDTASKEMFTAEELTAVCGRATGDMRLLIAIGLYTGLRLKDAVTLRWSEIDFRVKTIKRVTTKRKKAIAFPLHGALLEILCEHRKQADKGDEYVLPEWAATYRVARPKITRRITAFIENCGIKTKRELTEDDGQRKLRPVVKGYHSLRHSFVSLCAAKGVPQPVIQELVGHGSKAVNDIYMHASEEQKSEAIAALPAYEFGE